LTIRNVELDNREARANLLEKNNYEFSQYDKLDVRQGFTVLLGLVFVKN